MSKQQSKETVLECLSRLREPVSLQAISEQLDHVYPDRTLRRWLNELKNEGLIRKTGAKKAHAINSLVKMRRAIIIMPGKISAGKINTVIFKPTWGQKPFGQSSLLNSRYFPVRQWLITMTGLLLTNLTLLFIYLKIPVKSWLL